MKIPQPEAFPPTGLATVVPDRKLKMDEYTELCRLEALVLAEPTSERRRQELYAFKTAKGIA